METMSKVIVDIDSMLYAVGFATEADPLPHALHTLKIKLQALEERFNYPLEIWMDRRNGMTFRESMWSGYKGNRPKIDKPKHYWDMRAYLKEKWGAQEAPLGLETDDIVAIRLTEDPEAILAGIDKDLQQVPGVHYNWVKDEIIEVDPHTGLYNLYTQALVGDTSDNIPGVPGVGPVAARTVLSWCEEEIDFQNACLNQYEFIWDEDEARSAMDLTMNLLYLKRFENDSFRWLL